MPQEFTHYLITRYNVPFKNWDTDKAGNQVGHDEWMHQRLNLFKKYCVPTVVRQSNPGFHWLIYLDEQTNLKHVKAISDELRGAQNAELRFAANMEGLLADLRAVVSGCQTDYIITSRLDNDDGLGIDYIRNVQEAFLPQSKILINMVHGIMYDLDRRILTELRKAYLNHFTSLIEVRKAADECLTVLGFAHTQPPPDCVILNLHTTCSWLKIIHGRNLNSRTKGRPVLRSRILPCYTVDREDFPVSIGQTTLYAVGKGIERISKLFGRGKE